MNKTVLLILSATVAVGAIYLYQRSKVTTVSVGAKGVRDGGLPAKNNRILLGGQKSGISVQVPEFDVGQFLSGIFHQTNHNGTETTAASQVTSTTTTQVQS